MGDAKQGRVKNEYVQWTPEESKVLIELLVGFIKQGVCDSRGRISKRMVETKILPVLNERFKSRKNYKHYQHRMKFLKNQYLRFNPKFNSLTKKFMFPEEAREDLVHRHIAMDSFQEYEGLQLIFRNGTGKRRLEPVRSSDDTREADDNKEQALKEQGVNHDDDDDDEDTGDEERDNDSQEHPSSPLLCLNSEDPLEDLRPDKRARTEEGSQGEEDVLRKVYAELSSINATSKQILCMMQRRQAEEKTSNVWDAIKEVPNLKNRARYKALTSILKLEMKDIFVSMSVEDRLGWIHCNIYDGVARA